MSAAFGDVAAALQVARQRLITAGCAAASLEARMLVGHVLGISPDDVLTASRQPLTPADWADLCRLLERRTAGEPMAYILGRREFWSLSFRCTASTLIPRPETETLIEAVLARLPRRDVPLRVLDLGTGSGCLLLTVLHLYQAAWGVGVDRSAAALAVAQDNAGRLGLAARASFVCTDWLAPLAGTFDLILANPPYLSDAELAHLSPDVDRWEPHLALAGGADGLTAYRAILPPLAARLAANGCAVLEVGYGQAAAVSTLAIRAGFQHVEVSHDLAGIARCLTIASADRPMRKKTLGNQAVPV